MSSMFLNKGRNNHSCRIFSVVTAFTFLLNVIFSVIRAFGQVSPTILNLPQPGAMISISLPYTPLLVKGLKVNPNNPSEFNFIVDTGDTHLNENEFREESIKLIKYFLASLTTPEDDLWVNLSPYEKDRIIPQGFGKTEMGRDLLAQDYLLKQLTASLIYPQKEIGKEFWKKVYARAQKLYGTIDIPINTFNKVWIVPEKANVYEHKSGAFIVSSRLKVMLEGDYLALKENLESKGLGTHMMGKEEVKQINEVSFEVVKEVLIPIIEEEVNSGENFSTLRQIYNSMILATWYKRNLKKGLLGQIYLDKNKTEGISNSDKEINKKIYNQYVEAYKKGVYNFIKEDYDAFNQEMIPRKYFSGGVHLKTDLAMMNSMEEAAKPKGKFRNVSWKVEGIGGNLNNIGDSAMLVTKAESLEWNQRIHQFFNGTNVTVLGATGFVGRYLMGDLFKKLGNQIGQVKVLTRNPNGQNARQMFDSVQGLPGSEKLVAVQGDHLNIGQLRNVLAGSRIIVSAAGLAWQHPAGAIDKEIYSQYIPDIKRLSERDMKDEILLRQELIQNGISAGLLGLVMESDQRLVWTSTNATDNMFLRLNIDDKKRLKEEIDSRAKRYLEQMRQILASGRLNDISDPENFFMELVSKDLEEHPPLRFPKVKGGDESVFYAKVFSYNYSKYLGQLLLEMISEEDGKDIRVLMISDVYGPGQSINQEILTAQGGLRRVQVFLAAYKAITEGHQGWIPDIQEKSAHGFNVDASTHEIIQKVWRDYVSPTFVGDVSQMILHASSVSRLSLPPSKVVFNVSAPPISNGDFAKRLSKLLDVSVKIEISGEELFAQPEGQDDDLRLLGIQLTPLEDGIVQWIAQPKSDQAMVPEVELGIKYPDAGVKHQPQQETRTVFADLSGVGLFFNRWLQSDATPFTQEELAIFENAWQVKNKIDLNREDIVSIRYSSSDRSSGKMRMRIIALDKTGEKHFYELNGKDTTELMGTFKSFIPSLEHLREAKAVFQISAGNQSELPGNFTIIPEKGSWKLFGATDEQWERKNHRVLVEFSDGRRVPGLARLVGDTTTNIINKVVLTQGIENVGFKNHIELKPANIKFIMSATALGWGHTDTVALLKEYYTNTSDLRHIFRLPYEDAYGSLFYSQLANDEQLNKAFEGDVVRFSLNDNGRLLIKDEVALLMENNGYIIQDELKEIHNPGDFYIRDGYVYLILLPAKYPVNTLVISDDGQHMAFVSVQGKSGHLGANYWTFYSWVQEQVKKRFGWTPQVVFALDNGVDPYIQQFDHQGKPTVLVQGGRENYYASISVIPLEDQAMSSNVGGIDLNSSILDLQIQKDSRGFQQLNIPQNIGENIHIDGLAPVIINITPINNVLPLLGTSGEGEVAHLSFSK